MEFRPGSGAVFARRVELVILLFPAAFAAGIFLAFSRIFAAVFGGLCLTVFAVCFFTARKRLDCLLLKIEGEYAVISRGIYWRRQDIIPLEAVITAGISSNWLTGKMGLCTLRLGAVRRNIAVPLLSLESGEEILKIIKDF